MGYVFDRDAARRYAAWARSPQGQSMDRWLVSCLPGLLQIHAGERVLDIGCGQGSHLLFLKRLGLDISGVDASPHMIKRARERLGDKCTLETGLAEDLPFEDNTFDLSTMIHTLEFLENPTQALREAGRVTRRAVLVCVMNSVSWSTLSRKLKPTGLSFPLDQARLFSLWGLQGLMRETLGPVPMVWYSCPFLPSRLDSWCRKVTGRRLQTSLPFGPYLGLCATIFYRYKTDNLILRAPVRPRGRTVTNGAVRGNLNTLPGAECDERSLPV